jgi:hypothetical protein
MDTPLRYHLNVVCPTDSDGRVCESTRDVVSCILNFVSAITEAWASATIGLSPSHIDSARYTR